MNNHQDVVERVVEELHERGAADPTVQGDISLTKYATEKDHPGADATVEYLGDAETVRHACQNMDRVQLLDVSTHPWPGGEQEIQAQITVQDGGSNGVNPGGNVDDSASNSVPPPENDDEQNPHVPPGETFPLTDETGFTDHYKVAVWPVRWWEPRPDVESVIVLRYLPHPQADGLEWWAGYCRLGTEHPGRVLELVREKRIHAPTVDCVNWHGGDLTVDWHDGGWAGWSEASVPDPPTGVPVFTNVPENWGRIENRDAGRLTTALAQAVLEARRRVTG